jgi:hypothetical protein
MRYPLAALALLAAGCPGPRKPPVPPQPPPATRRVGSCADPNVDGVVGKMPRLRRADRDLDGDGAPEQVVADEALCAGEGNCYWNVFYADPADPRSESSPACTRYAGTLAGAAIEPLASRGERRFSDLRVWWRFGGGRLLVQEYRFRMGGYQVTDALLCAEGKDDRILCAEEPDQEP